MTLKLPLWTLIPTLMIFTLTFFLIFNNYTIQKWTMGNMLAAGLIGFVYLGESIYKELKK